MEGAALAMLRQCQLMGVGGDHSQSDIVIARMKAPMRERAIWAVGFHGATHRDLALPRRDPREGFRFAVGLKDAIPLEFLRSPRGLGDLSRHLGAEVVDLPAIAIRDEALCGRVSGRRESKGWRPIRSNALSSFS